MLPLAIKDLKQLEVEKDLLDHANSQNSAKFLFLLQKQDEKDRLGQIEAAKALCKTNCGYFYFGTCTTKGESVSAVFVKVSKLASAQSISDELGMCLSVN